MCVDIHGSKHGPEGEISVAMEALCEDDYRKRFDSAAAAAYWVVARLVYAIPQLDRLRVNIANQFPSIPRVSRHLRESFDAHLELALLQVGLSELTHNFPAVHARAVALDKELWDADAKDGGLEEAVKREASEIAAKVNASGRVAQIEFLFAHGMTMEQIRTEAL